MKYKDIRFRFFKNTAYIHIIPLIKLWNSGIEKYTWHTIARLAVFMCAFCHVPVENLLKGPGFRYFRLTKWWRFLNKVYFTVISHRWLVMVLQHNLKLLQHLYQAFFIWNSAHTIIHNDIVNDNDIDNDNAFKFTWNEKFTETMAELTYWEYFSSAYLILSKSWLLCMCSLLQGLYLMMVNVV